MISLLNSSSMFICKLQVCYPYEVLCMVYIFRGLFRRCGVNSLRGGVRETPPLRQFRGHSSTCQHLLYKVDSINDFSARYFPYDSKIKDPNQQAIPNHHNQKIPKQFHLVHKGDRRSLAACQRKPDQNSAFKAASAKNVEVGAIDPKTREAMTIYGTADAVINNAGSRVVVTLKRYHMRSGASSEHIQELDLFTIPLSPLGYDFELQYAETARS